MSFSDRLKKLREERNVSQKEVAESIGISDVMVSMYEQGKKQPSVDKLEKLAAYYGVTMDYLKGTDSSINELEEAFPEGVQVLRRASKELTPEAKRKDDTTNESIFRRRLERTREVTDI